MFTDCFWLRRVIADCLNQLKMEHTRLGSPANHLIKTRHTFDQIIAAGMAIQDKANKEEIVSRLDNDGILGGFDLDHDIKVLKKYLVLFDISVMQTSLQQFCNQ